MTAIIELKELSHTYSPNSVFEATAIRDINLKIYPGEMTALIGHTGSGKSTLIQHMNGLLKPTAGQVFVDGADIHVDKKGLKLVRQKVGLVFQYPEHQLFESTVYNDVMFGLTKMEVENADEYVKTALTAVGIGEDLYEKSPFELSGGQKRRVAIAGVLAMRPAVLILDEPTAGLDPKGREEILSQIKSMHEQMNLTVILVSHSMDDAARLADRVLVMDHGRVVLDGLPADVFSQGELLRDIGLDVPQLAHVFELLNKINPNIPTGVFTMEAALTALGRFRS